MDNNSKDTQKSANYNLKSDAVEALANADSGETPEYSKEELNQYRTRKGFRIPDAVKIIFAKLWFAGAVYYFIGFSIGGDLPTIDLLVVLGVVLGMITDILTNNLISYIEKTPGDNDKWLLFPKKGMVSFFLNILYSCLIVVGVYGLYNVINYTINSITGEIDALHFGVEPVGFGAFCMGIDLLCIGLKHLIVKAFHSVTGAAKSR